MRICYLANTAIPSSNASAIQIVKTCESFSKLKHEVLLITTNVSEGEIFNFYDVKEKFKVIKLEKFRNFPLGIKYYLFSILSILKSSSFKADLYITRNFFTCLILILLKKKVILEIHHDLNSESRIVKFLVKNFNYLNSKYLVKVIAITNYVKKTYVSKYKLRQDKIEVLPSGSSIIAKFNFRKNAKNLNIGYFGSLYESRGLNLLISLAKIDKKNNYYVYGNTKQLKNLIAKKNIKNLNIKNYIPYKEIPKILMNMEVLLMPYVSNITAAGDFGDITRFTSPLKLFDYLSVGRVILCSNYSVLHEILKNKKNAIFIENYRNVFAWKREIEKLANQKEKMLIISKNNFIYSKQFTHIKRANEILKNIIY